MIKKLSKTTGTKGHKGKSTITVTVSEIKNNIELKEMKKQIEKLDYDFGRGDLNLMRDKINELIDNGN